MGYARKNYCQIYGLLLLKWGTDIPLFIFLFEHRFSTNSMQNLVDFIQTKESNTLLNIYVSLRNLKTHWK